MSCIWFAVGPFAGWGEKNGEKGPYIYRRLASASTATVRGCTLPHEMDMPPLGVLAPDAK